MQDRSFQQRVGRIETLVAELETISDPAVRASVKELIASVMELNAVGFERVMEVASRYGDAASRMIDVLIRDEAVSSLLILYGLHPQDFETRVRAAVQAFPGVTVVSIEGERVTLRMESHDRAESTLRRAVYAAAPDIAELVIEGGNQQNGFVPLAALSGAHP
ncbi:MAG TPA: hypothetical protein VME17_06875 [Bryobacteraceae bacterium]|nr:hypothetical protein [Bryobacteraceae bacterium]